MFIAFKFFFDIACHLAAGWLLAHAFGWKWDRGVALVIAYGFFRLGHAPWK